jgi:hypothetical protein
VAARVDQQAGHRLQLQHGILLLRDSAASRRCH